MSSTLMEEEVQSVSTKLHQLKKVLQSVIYGQNELIENVIVSLICGGHVLLEGLPGLGKTELVKGLAKALDLSHKRIQFTPDLLPGDITGNPILQDDGEGKRKFVFQPGPLFGNLILADEINRASPKTQSAMLEAMQERRVTVMGNVHLLPQPFLVMATQNPIELEGTYPLPEAQLDRFLFKIHIHRNDPAILKRIVLERELGEEITVDSVLSQEELLGITAMARRVYLPEVVAGYIARLVDATHPGQSSSATYTKFGASPRAAIGFAAASKARALFHGRINSSFEDVQALATSVLQHRIILDYKAKIEGKSAVEIVNSLVEEVSTQDREFPLTLKEEE